LGYSKGRKKMTVSLSKGGNVSLTKLDPKLEQITLGLGWNPRITDGAAFDLDASVFLLASTGKVRSEADFIFFNNLKSACGSVVHSGDELTGAKEGDDEQIKVNLATFPADVVRITFCVTIYEAEIRKQNFGMVSGAFIRILNAKTNEELVRYDLSEDYSLETAMVFGELYRHGAEWKFKAVGEGFAGGLAAMSRSFGVNA